MNTQSNSNLFAFKSLIRRVLKEEIEKTSSSVGGETFARVPEMNSKCIPDKKDNKVFASDANPKDAQGKESLLADMIESIKGIDNTVSVIWDDHDDLMVNARDLKYIRISPRWENYYVIEMMTRNEDRIWMTGLDWTQVKDFVKLQLKNLNKQPTAVDKAYDKSYRNREDQIPSPDKGMPQQDKPAIKPLTNEPVKTSKNKEKDYTEKQTKDDDDLPNKPMKEVKDFKKTIDYKVQDPVKLRKRKPDTKLTVKQT